MGFSTGIEIKNLVESDVLNQDWAVCLAQFEGATEQERHDCLEPVAVLRNEFVKTLDAVTDETERDVVFAVFYILLKSHWMLFNVRSGYLIDSGTLDMRLMCRSGLISALLDRIEKTIPPEIVHSITEFISQPLARPGDMDAFPVSSLTLDDAFTEQFHALIQRNGTDSEITGCPDREKELIQMVLKQQELIKGFRAERAIVEDQFGKISLRQVCELFTNMRHSLTSVVDQLNQLKAERKELCETLGVSSVSLIAVQNQTHNAELEKAQTELERLRDREKRLADALGTADVDEIIKRLQSGETNSNVYDELQEMLGSLETSFDYIN